MEKVVELDVEICNNLSEEMFSSAWSHDKVSSENLSSFISNLHLIKCKKSEATTLLIVGERPDYLKNTGAGAYGNWKKGVKNIWLKSKN